MCPSNNFRLSQPPCTPWRGELDFCYDPRGTDDECPWAVFKTPWNTSPALARAGRRVGCVRWGGEWAGTAGIAGTGGEAGIAGPRAGGVLKTRPMLMHLAVPAPHGKGRSTPGEPARARGRGNNTRPAADGWAQPGHQLPHACRLLHLHACSAWRQRPAAAAAALHTIPAHHCPWAGRAGPHHTRQPAKPLARLLNVHHKHRLLRSGRSATALHDK